MGQGVWGSEIPGIEKRTAQFTQKDPGVDAGPSWALFSSCVCGAGEKAGGSEMADL